MKTTSSRAIGGNKSKGTQKTQSTHSKSISPNSNSNSNSNYSRFQKNKKRWNYEQSEQFIKDSREQIETLQQAQQQAQQQSQQSQQQSQQTQPQESQQTHRYIQEQMQYQYPAYHQVTYQQAINDYQQQQMIVYQQQQWALYHQQVAASHQAQYQYQEQLRQEQLRQEQEQELEQEHYQEHLAAHEENMLNLFQIGYHPEVLLQLKAQLGQPPQRPQRLQPQAQYQPQPQYQPQQPQPWLSEMQPQENVVLSKPVTQKFREINKLFNRYSEARGPLLASIVKPLIPELRALGVWESKIAILALMLDNILVCMCQLGDCCKFGMDCDFCKENMKYAEKAGYPNEWCVMGQDLIVTAIDLPQIPTYKVNLPPQPPQPCPHGSECRYLKKGYCKNLHDLQ